MFLHLDDFFFFEDLKNFPKGYFNGCMIKSEFLDSFSSNKVEIFLEQREVAFLSPSKIFANFAG